MWALPPNPVTNYYFTESAVLASLLGSVQEACSYTRNFLLQSISPSQGYSLGKGAPAPPRKLYSVV